MELDLGWDPRTADVVVGTSAGSLAGALLRRGVPASDLSAITVGAEPRSSPPGTAEALRARPNLPPVRLGHMFGALASVLPDGKIDLSEHTVAVDGLLGTDWPEDDLWVCTVRQDDLRRVVFGRDAWASLPAAVGASCAVPGYFRPVRIDGRPYIDGGVRSPTNADVLRRRELDLAVVISPMSGRELGLGAGDAIRRRARRQLRHECERLRQAGIPSVVIEQGAEVTAVLGSDFMSNARLQEIVRAAFIDAGEQLRAPITRTLLAGLYGRPRR